MTRGIVLVTGLTLIGLAAAARAQDVTAPLTDEQREAIEARAVELHELARELQSNAVELVELETMVEPEIVERIERSLVRSSRPMLGINIATGDDDTPVEGVEVAATTPGGPAAEAGLRAGDVIVEFAGEELESDSARIARGRLLEALGSAEVGESVELDYLRDGERRTVSVTPTRSWLHVAPRMPRPPRPPGAVRALEFGFAPGVDFMLSGMQRQWDGMELVKLTPELGRYFGTEEGLLVVRKPQRSTPIEEGDVIQRIGGRVPASVSQAMRILRSYDVGDSVDVEVMRDKRQRRIEVVVADPDEPSS